MKNLILSVALLVVSITLASLMNTGCSLENPNEKVWRETTEHFFAGNNVIQRMMPNTTEKTSFGVSGFFLFGSGAIGGSGHSESVLSVTFSWKPQPESSFIITTLPLKKVRVQFSDSIQTPTVSFKLIYITDAWTHLCYNAVTGQSEQGPEWILDNYLAYAVITVRPENWPTKIQMPL